jgi:hypothetical protein
MVDAKTTYKKMQRFFYSDASQVEFLKPGQVPEPTKMPKGYDAKGNKIEDEDPRPAVRNGGLRAQKTAKSVIPANGGFSPRVSTVR